MVSATDVLLKEQDWQRRMLELEIQRLVYSHDVNSYFYLFFECFLA